MVVIVLIVMMEVAINLIPCQGTNFTKAFLGRSSWKNSVRLCERNKRLGLVKVRVVGTEKQSAARYVNIMSCNVVIAQMHSRNKTNGGLRYSYIE